MSVISILPFSNQLRTLLFFFKAFGFGSEQVKVLTTYLHRRLFPEFADATHLGATMEWLRRAQNACGGDGVSNVYYLRDGWGVAYPETSGYILVTFLAYADNGGDESYVEQAIKIAEWEIRIQAQNGGVLSSTELPQTRVFNTGQVILGWCALYERVREPRFLAAAERAGNYLIGQQESDGAWRRDTYCGARTYHAGVDWALLRLAALTGNRSFEEAACKNLRWVLAQQRSNGWFSQCGFNDDHPNTHVILYTLRGLLECSQIDCEATRSLSLLPAAIKGADALCAALQTQPVADIQGMVPTAFDEEWKSPARDSCLTGNAQLSCFLYRLAHVTGNESYRHIADSVLSATKRTQLLETSLLPLKGAVAGTYPLSHGYVSNGYPNWAAKFYADALLMKINYPSRLVVPA